MSGKGAKHLGTSLKVKAVSPRFRLVNPDPTLISPRDRP